jgi:hypothetical protein
MTRKVASSGAVIAANGSIRVDQPSMSAFGLHIEWKLPPPASMWQADLDGSRLKFTDTSRHEFAVRLACDGSEQSCAADGDVVTTVVAVGSLASNLHSELRVETQVQSRLSCRNTQVRIEPDSEGVPSSTKIRVRVRVNDVDSLPVGFTRADIDLSFGGHTLPMQWSRGSNDYIADVPAALTKPGRYDLIVSANNAWNETAGQVTSCELLRRTITAKEGLSTSSWILAGACGAAVVVVGGLVIVVRKRHAHLQAIMAMLFTEVG